jgi:hypothetical protein
VPSLAEAPDITHAVVKRMTVVGVETEEDLFRHLEEMLVLSTSYGS